MTFIVRASAALGFVLLAAAPAAARCDELWAAALSNDVAAITRLVNGGENVNCRDPLTAETALMAGATNGSVDTVKFLLTRGADPKIRNAKGETALDMARAREATFARMPNMAAVAQRHRQVIAMLAPLAAGPQKPVAPVTVVPTDMDTVARLTLDAARVALTARQYDSAGQAVLDVIQMSGVPERRRAQAYTVGCDLGMRTRDWELAKTMCEKVLGLAGAAVDDRVWATETLNALRKQMPGLFGAAK